MLAFATACLAGAVFAQVQPPRPGDDPRPPSRVIYPEQTLPLRFSHAQHLRIAGVTCERCHAAAQASDRVEDRLTPPESSCAGCHPIARDLAATGGQPADPARGVPTGRCQSCHPDWRESDPLRVRRVDVPAARIRFSHARHLRRGAPCVSCHAEVARVGLATRLELPRMEQCLQCHRPGGAPRADLLRGLSRRGRLRPLSRHPRPRWRRLLAAPAGLRVSLRRDAARERAALPCLSRRPSRAVPPVPLSSAQGAA